MSMVTEMDDMDQWSGYALRDEDQPGLDLPGVEPVQDATRTPEIGGADAYATGARRGLSEKQRDAQDRDLAAAHAAGESQRAVAARYGVSFGTVNRAVHRFGDPVEPGAVTLPTVEDTGEDSPTCRDHQYPGAGSPDLQKHDPVDEPGRRTVSSDRGRTALVPADVAAARRATTPEDLPEGPERTVFTHSPATRAVWLAARARMASPWGVLGYVMALTVATTGPHVRTPATVGGSASLNLLVGLVGAPGTGKGAARRTAIDLFTYADSNGTPVDTPMMGVGSGEGIAETFALRTRTGDDGEEVTSQAVVRAVFDDTEISSMAKKSDRRGSTLLPMLCKAYMGEDLGNQNGTAESSRMVPDHSYRMCLTVGIQPDRAGVLLDDSAGGTPQRFVWLPVAYPAMPDVTPEPPEGFTIALPFGTLQTVRPGAEPMTVTIPKVAERAIRQARLSSGRGESQGLDGHLLLTREKVAIALALMSGSLSVTDADWSAAGAVIALSTSTREMCRAACRGAGVEAAAARRIEDAEGRDQAADAMAEKYARTVRERVLSAVQDSGGRAVLHGDLNRRLSGRKQSDGLSQRDRLPGVLQLLVDDGLILESETMDGNGNPATEYTLPRQ